jgi:hypothetical protein
MNQKWFRKFGWAYLPVSWQGFIVSLLLIAFLVNTFIAVDRHSHSVSDTLYGIFPFWVPSFLVWLWIGSNTSEKR